jgi:2-polyprenyl-6-methoxyphenol hydroxylase-like FAD-dependent oxidoreductase
MRSFKPFFSYTLTVERDRKLPVWKSHEVQRIYKADVFFGADGAFSAVRQSLMNYPLFNYSQQYETHGYKVRFRIKLHFVMVMFQMCVCVCEF